MAEDSLTPLTPPPEKIVEALKAFEKAIGGRDLLIQSLTHSPQDEADVIARLLADPANQSRSLAALCAAANLSVGKFFKIFATAKGAAAYLQAMDRVWDEAPEVAEDAMIRAKTVIRDCRICKGKGWVKAEVESKTKAGFPKYRSTRVPCRDCHGIGRIEAVPDVERVKVALQLAGLLRSEPKVTVDQSRHQTNQVVVADSMRSFIAATNRLLYGALPPSPSEVPEVDVIDVPATPVSQAEES